MSQENYKEDLKNILDTVRPSFEFNVSYIKKYLQGLGLDMGCGSCPLLELNCLHIDISPQPLCELQVEKHTFIQTDAVTFRPPGKAVVDYIFSSHMVEDLPTEDAIVNCLNNWAEFLRKDGYLVLLLPDMQGGRYWTVEEGGNPSHRVNVGKPFIDKIKERLSNLEIVQVDTIPHDRSCTIDVVFKKI